MWKKGRLGLPLENIGPVNSGEESVLLQCSRILFPKSETFFHLTTEQLLQDVFCVRSEVVLQLQLPLQYPLGDDLPVVASEGRGPCEHVVDEDPKAPPVHFLAMSTNRVETLIVWRFTIKGERERMRGLG